MWIREEHPIWDENKKRVIYGNRENFNFENIVDDGELTGYWYKLCENEEIIYGYGWIDISEDVEISISISNNYQNRRFGSQILEVLQGEVRNLGYGKITGVIKSENKNATIIIIHWLYDNGFVGKWPGLTGLNSLTIEQSCAYVKRAPITLRKTL